jgi:hypothetical protein
MHRTGESKGVDSPEYREAQRKYTESVDRVNVQAKQGEKLINAIEKRDQTKAKMEADLAKTFTGPSIKAFMDGTGQLEKLKKTTEGLSESAAREFRLLKDTAEIQIKEIDKRVDNATMDADEGTKAKAEIISALEAKRRQLTNKPVPKKEVFFSPRSEIEREADKLSRKREGKFKILSVDL